MIDVPEAPNTWEIRYDDGVQTLPLIPLAPGGSIVFETRGGKVEAFVLEDAVHIRPHSDGDLVVRPDTDGITVAIEVPLP
jgi:hypothetical protein